MSVCLGLLLLMGGASENQSEKQVCAFVLKNPEVILYSWNSIRLYYEDDGDEDDTDENKQQGDRQLPVTDSFSAHLPFPALLANRNVFLHSCPLFCALQKLRL